MSSARPNIAIPTQLSTLLKERRMESIESVQLNAMGKLDYVTSWIDRKNGRRVKATMGKEELRRVEERSETTLAVDFLGAVTKMIALNTLHESMK